MSHFTVGVIVPGPADDEFDAEAAVDEPLAPFNENSDVEPYRDYLDEGDEARMLDYYRRETLKGLLGEVTEEEADTGVLGDEPQPPKPGTVDGMSEEEVAAKLVELGHPFTREDLPGKMEDWRGCEGGIEEDGRLYAVSTYNPDSKWDWYQVGGRWSGMFGEGKPDYAPIKDLLADIEANAELRAKYVQEKAAQRERIIEFLKERAAAKGDPEPTEEELRSGVEGVTWALGMGGVRDATPEQEAKLRINMTDEEWQKANGVSFFAMLTLDGEWLEKGEMGWFGTSSNNKDAGDWMSLQEAALRAAVEQDPDAVLVVVDCHI